MVCNVGQEENKPIFEIITDDTTNYNTTNLKAKTLTMSQHNSVKEEEWLVFIHHLYLDNILKTQMTNMRDHLKIPC